MRHLTREEIIKNCAKVAREKRIANRSAWTAMGNMCGYSMLKSEKFSGQKIAKICSKIDVLEEEYSNNKIDLKKVSDDLMKKADWTIEYIPYEEKDAYGKKGSFEKYFNRESNNACNIVNEYCSRYLLFFFKVLIDDYGFGKIRLTRVKDYLNMIREAYANDNSELKKWKNELLDEAGLVYENPIDPINNL